jgi:DNA polymerase III delta prime subunit
MDLLEFKRRARKAFGSNMEHATPANVREFVDIVNQELWREDRAKRLLGAQSPIPVFDFSSRDQSISYETAVREFFSSALNAQDERALVILWLYALDLSYSGIEQLENDALGPLFPE